ncbi:MAG: hypothetical protein JJU45_18500 [Acidimicrobiia bacterium]|nr:hypothetical protein [Acidimicrobiia bacterium]
MDTLVHADWGVAPTKRWAATAERTGAGWEMVSLAPLGSGPSFSECLGIDGRATTLVGVDFPLGVPAAWADRAQVSSFPELVAGLGSGRWAGFSDVAGTSDEISLERPFYPHRAGPRGTVRRAHLTDALGLTWDQLHRRCEQPAADQRAACPLFWTLGANQVGKGALAGWALLRSEDPDRAAVWPFHGTLPELVSGPASVVLAETYPADGYGLLGLSPVQGKRRNEVRRRAGGALLAAADRLSVRIDGRLRTEIATGLGDDAAGEDRFDAVVGLLVLAAVASGSVPTGEPRADPAVTSVEGWILGRSATTRPRRA